MIPEIQIAELIKWNESLEDNINEIINKSNELEAKINKLSNPIDYKELLTKYIKHVGFCEGAVFIYRTPREMEIYGSDEVKFTEDEVIELNRLDKLSE